jgi:hypothetical protein
MHVCGVGSSCWVSFICFIFSHISLLLVKRLSQFPLALTLPFNSYGSQLQEPNDTHVIKTWHVEINLSKPTIGISFLIVFEFIHQWARFWSSIAI